MFKFSICQCTNTGNHGSTELAGLKDREGMAYWVGPSVFGKERVMS